MKLQIILDFVIKLATIVAPFINFKKRKRKWPETEPSAESTIPSPEAV